MSSSVELTENVGYFPLAGNRYIPGTILTAACVDQSKQPQQDQELTSICLASGEWTNDLLSVSCDDACHSLDDIDIVGTDENSTWAYSTTAAGGLYFESTVATKTCADGYALEDDNTVTIIELTCRTEGWLPKAPSCVSVGALG